jgi:Ca2+-binding RTX toxin-like protein
MAHLIATQAIDFNDVPELTLLTQNPVYSGASATGFTATLGAVAVTLSGSNFDYESGIPIAGKIDELNATAGGSQSFTIQNPGVDYSTLKNALEDTLEHGLDNIFNADDVLDGSVFDDYLIGYDGDDVVNSNKGDDILDGRFEMDSLDGGKGQDTLIGGGFDDGHDGLDTFVFSAKAKKTNADKVMDFIDGDVVHLDNTVFKKLKKDGPLKAKYFDEGSQADDGNDFVIYDPGSGKLFWDGDGDGDSGKKLVATFKGKPDIDHGDIFVV